MDAALREELAELTASVRAWLEHHAGSGTVGLPSGSYGAALDDAPAPIAAAAPAARPPAAVPPAAAPPPAFDPPAPPRVLHASEPRVRFGEDPRPAPASSPAAAAAPAVQAPAEGLDERRRRLALIAEAVRVCQACPLHEERTQTVFARGSPTSEIVFVGEGPGAEEDLQGEPFVGPAGQLLDRMIAAMGYRRDEIYVCNVVKCRPPKNRKPEPAEMASCSGYLADQLAVVAPKVIVALGATAVQGLTGTTEGISRLRGTWKLYKGKIPIMPTFHPAYLLRQPGAKREVWADLKEVLRFLGRGVPERG